MRDRSDEQLMKTYAGGNMEAFEVLYERHCGHTSRYCPADDPDLAESSEHFEDESDEIILTPEAWIEYMLELQKAERNEELKVELEAFRKAYPAYPLPSQLRD